ncbi:6-bladed beta-propeller, partial [bacterium]
MKKIIILSLLFIIEVALCNCSNQSIKTPSISIDFKATQGNYTGLNESLFKEEAIKVIGDSNLSIESCSKFLLTSKNYIILDEMQQKVWFINFNGEISHWIDYSNMDNNHKSEIFDLCIVGMDSSALFDIRLKKIVLYNEEGKFLEEHSVPFNYGNFESLTKDVYFFSLGRVNRKSPDIDYGQFCIYNVNDNKIINSFLPYSTCFKNWISYRKDLAKDNNRLVCITSFNNTIFALKNNSFAPLISLDFGDNNIDTTGLDNA